MHPGRGGDDFGLIGVGGVAEDIGPALVGALDGEDDCASYAVRCVSGVSRVVEEQECIQRIAYTWLRILQEEGMRLAPRLVPAERTQNQILCTPQIEKTDHLQSTPPKSVTIASLCRPAESSPPPGTRGASREERG